MSRLSIPTAASSWDHNVLGSIGMSFRRTGSFNDFFGIEPPTIFGVGLSLNLQAYVAENVRRVCEIGLTNSNRVRLAADYMPFHRDVLDFFKAENGVMVHYPNEESAVDEFAKETMKLLGFNLIPSIDIHGPTSMSTKVAGIKVDANADIVVSNSETKIILIVQEDKSLLSKVPRQDAIAQLMVEALAAFTYNNLEHNFEKQIIYGILLRGTIPMFFKFPMTQASVRKIQNTREEIDDILIDGEYYCPHLEMNEVGYLRTKQEYLVKFLQCFEAMRRMAIPVQDE